MAAGQGGEGQGRSLGRGRLPNPAFQTKEGLGCVLGQSKKEASIHVGRDAH